MRSSLFLLSVVVCLSMVNAQTVTTLHPGPEEGKDALIKSCVSCGNWNMNNYGEHQSLPAIAWTNGGNVSNIRALLAFDLGVIPAGSTILEARLSLYHDPSSNEGEHSTLSGPNNCLIQRIIAPWDELTVTWADQPAATAVNQVILPASTTGDQDFEDIDVTELVTDMFQDPNGNHGFLLSMATESYYRRVVFASSDHPEHDLQPKLVITHQSAVGMVEGTAASFRIHPNPTNGLFRIEGSVDGLEVSVHDAMGKLVHSERVWSNVGHSMDLSVLPPGCYMVRLSGRGYDAAQRVLLQ